MRLIKVTGGLGNQMFIYAFYLNMVKKYKRTKIDISDMVHYDVHNGYEMNRIFKLSKKEFCINQPLKKVLEFLFFKTILERKQDNRTLNAYNKKYAWPLIYFKGFYQSERFFEDIKEEIHNTFVFDETLISEKNLSLINIIDNDKNSISIHVRRGDYLNPKHWDAIGCVCQLPYYKNAIKEMNKLVENPSYYVFSDDIAWAKDNLGLENAVYVDWNKKEDSWQDMMLMSHCKYNIISNSTFSWWGAWLNKYSQKKVLVPERWFNNNDAPYIYPKEWIKIPIK